MAAVTSVTTSLSSAPAPQEKFVMRVDRPFFFAIRDRVRRASVKPKVFPMLDCGVVGRVPSLPRFQLFRRTRKNPRGVTYHAMLIELVVHHDLPDTEIEQECRLLKEQVVGLSVRRVMKLLDADNTRLVVFVKS